jgi:catechol 2,3-dioxygenase-like lactoylglutathione lyase family enzyme
MHERGLTWAFMPKAQRTRRGLAQGEETMDDNSPAKLHDATPVFLVDDIPATMQWYCDHLGFKARAVPESPPHHFCILKKDDVEIFLQQLDGYRKPDLYDNREGGVWSVYLRVQGVRELFHVLSTLKEVTMLEPLCHQPYGPTEFVIRDPNGYVLVFAEPD